MRRVLVLRPEPAATATVERAREMGLEATAVPLFRIKPVPWTAPDAREFDALLLTSANAARHGGEELKKLDVLPVYAVGAATARAARDAHFRIAAFGNEGVDRLLESIPPGLRLLHLCGEHRKMPSVMRQEITPIVAYRATEISEPELSDASGGIALIHSPRAGRRFAQLIEDRGDIAIAAISRAAAEAVGSGWGTVVTADEPNDDALLALTASLCNNPSTE